MIVGRLMKSVVGIRIVLGLLFASVAGLGMITWLWMGAEEDAAEAEAAAQTAREAAERNADRVAEIKAERERLDRIVTKQRQADRERRDELQQQVGELRDAIAETECGPAAMPEPVRRRVFDDTGDRNRSGGSEGDGTAGSD